MRHNQLTLLCQRLAGNSIGDKCIYLIALICTLPVLSMITSLFNSPFLSVKMIFLKCISQPLHELFVFQWCCSLCPLTLPMVRGIFSFKLLHKFPLDFFQTAIYILQIIILNAGTQLKFNQATTSF